MEKRDALQSLLETVQTEGIDLVIVPRLNRFGRSLRDILNNLHVLEEHDCHLVSLTENADFSFPYGKAMLAVMGALSEIKVQQQIEDSLRSKKKMMQDNNANIGNLPWGYKFDASNQIIIDRDKQKRLTALF